MSEAPETIDAAETAPERRQRKFAAGVFAQTGALFNVLTAGVFVAGVVAPITAATIGTTHIPTLVLAKLGSVSFGISVALAVIASVSKGFAKVLDDDRLPLLSRAKPTDGFPTP